MCITQAQELFVEIFITEELQQMFQYATEDFIDVQNMCVAFAINADSLLSFLKTLPDSFWSRYLCVRNMS